MNKNTGALKGKLCSGWGVFPSGIKCKGCDDCKNGTHKQKIAKKKERKNKSKK